MASKDNKTPLDDDQITRLLSQLGERETPSDLTRRQVKQNVKSVWLDELKQESRSRYSRYFAAAAVIIIAITGLIVVQPVTNTPIAPHAFAQVTKLVESVQYQSDNNWQPLDKAEITEKITLRSLADSYASIELASGINLRLAPESEINLVRVDLVNLISGHVYIDSRQTSAPIVITTPFGDATDIGTQFMVSVEPDRWRIQVREGIVEVTHPLGTLSAKAGDLVQLKPNDTEILRSQISPDDTSWDWTQQVTQSFDLEGASVSDYLTWVGRESGKKVRYASEAIENAAKRTILHGAITGLEPIKSLNIVLPTTRFTWSDQEPSILFIKLAKD